MIRIDNKPYYFTTPLYGQTKIFPASGNILRAYLRRNSKNSYEIIIAGDDFCRRIRDAESMKECCQILQNAYNAEL